MPNLPAPALTGWPLFHTVAPDKKGSVINQSLFLLLFCHSILQDDIVIGNIKAPNLHNLNMSSIVLCFVLRLKTNCSFQRLFMLNYRRVKHLRWVSPGLQVSGKRQYQTMRWPTAICDKNLTENESSCWTLNIRKSRYVQCGRHQ